MATRTVKARVELDGEKQYKQALSEINSGNKVLSSEMRKLQAEYKNNADSTEFLTKKGDLLQRQLLSQKEKIQTLKDALQASAEKYGEADKRTQDWIVKLNNAEAAEYDLQHAIEENNAALNGENQTMLGLGDTVDELANKFGIHLPEGATKALNGMKGLSAGTVAAMGAAAAAITAVIKTVSELHKLTLEAAADADELITQSMTTGLTTQTLQQLQYAENLIDVSASTITGSMTKMIRNMQSARDGNEDLAESFSKLGVSIVNEADGSLRNAEDVFFDLIDALGKVGNETERDAMSMDIFGKSAQELNPLIIQGTDTLRGYMDAANENYVLTEAELAQLGAVDDAVQQQKLSWEGLKNQLAVQFAPASKEAIEQFTKLTEAAGKALIDSGIIDGVADIFQALLGMIEPITDLFGLVTNIFSPLQQVGNALKGIAIVIATIADAVNVLQGLQFWNWGSGKLSTALGWNASSGQYSNIQKVLGYGDMSGNSYDSTTGLYTGNYYAGNSTGNDNWRGGLTWVGENGAELVNLPRGTQISNAQDSRNAGGVHIDTVVIDAKNVKDFNDVVALFSGYRVLSRMGVK